MESLKKNLKNMFVHVKRNPTFSEEDESTNFLGFGKNGEMVFEKKKLLALAKVQCEENGKKVLVLNGKKYHLINKNILNSGCPQKPLGIMLGKTTKTLNESLKKASKDVSQKSVTITEDLNRRKIIVTPLNLLPKKVCKSESRDFGIGTSDFDLGTSTDKCIQTEEQWDIMLDMWTRYLNDEDADDLISGKDMNLASGGEIKENKELESSKKRKEEFYQDLTGCMRWEAGNLPIHKAVAENDIPMVRRQCVVLKVRNGDVNVRNHQNLTPLHLAILSDASRRLCRVLLENDADADAVDASGNNALHLAVTKNRYDLVELLLEKEEFGGAAAPDIDRYNHEGFTALMLCASEEDRIDVAEKLLKKGAQPNLKDLKSGRTALFHAAENHNTPMVSLLLDYSADTKIRNFFGTSVHDAMFELDDMPKEIKYPILGRDLKIHQKRKLNQHEKHEKVDLGTAVIKDEDRGDNNGIKIRKLEIVPTYQKIANSRFSINRNK